MAGAKAWYEKDSEGEVINEQDYVYRNNSHVGRMRPCNIGDTNCRLDSRSVGESAKNRTSAFAGRGLLPHYLFDRLKCGGVRVLLYEGQGSWNTVSFQCKGAPSCF
jgi:hypothetical protein